MIRMVEDLGRAAAEDERGWYQGGWRPEQADSQGRV